MHQSFTASAKDFIREGTWFLPTELQNRYPTFLDKMKKVFIPISPGIVHIAWCDSISGNLNFKDAFSFLNPPASPLNWSKLIWKHFIPPSKSLLLWRLIHKRMPTDENLQARGCITVSICSLCNEIDETGEHLFLTCKFEQEIQN